MTDRTRIDMATFVCEYREYVGSESRGRVMNASPNLQKGVGRMYASRLPSERSWTRSDTPCICVSIEQDGERERGPVKE